MKRFYIASGWFNENQARDLENIKQVLDKLQVSYYSPKDEFLVGNDSSKDNLKNAFRENINAIEGAEFLIVNTRDKDMGTIFEAGVGFYAGKKMIYYCEGLTGNFNLMLAQSGIAVATSKRELEVHVMNALADPNYKAEYGGKIE